MTMISPQSEVERTARKRRQTTRIGRRCARSVAGLAFWWVLSLVTASAVETLTNGALIVKIDNNGAIHSATYKGHECFRIGTYVSDFGMQEGGNTSTFLLFDAYGLKPRPVSVTMPSPGLVRVAGNFAVGSAPVEFLQDYSLVPGKNVLKVDVSLRNTAEDAKTIHYFATFDPDMRVFESYLDVDVVSGIRSAICRTGLTGFADALVLGSPDSSAVVSTGDYLYIDAGLILNSILASPMDPNNLMADFGMHLIVPATIEPGATKTFTYFLSFGDNPDQAKLVFTQAVMENLAFSSFPSSQTLNEGTPASFTAVVTPSEGAQYQWYQDGTPILDATGPTLDLGVADLGDEGTYSLTAWNWSTSITKSFTLAVNTAPSITAEPDPLAFNEDATGTATITLADAQTPGSALVAKVMSSSPESLLPPGSATLSPSGATRTLTVVPAPNANGLGTVTLSVTDGLATTLHDLPVNVIPVNDAPTLAAISPLLILKNQTGNVPLTLEDIDTPPEALTVTVESSNESLLAPDGWEVTGTGTSRTLALAPVADAFGECTLTVTVSDGELSAQRTFTLHVQSAPVFTEQPQGGVFASASSLALSGTAVAYPSSLTYQWYRNGQPVSGATSPSLVLVPANPAASGTYVLRAANTAGSTDSEPAIVSIYNPMTVAGLPSSLLVDEGAPFSLAGTVAGSAPFTLQWEKDGSPLAGAHEAAYSVAFATPAHEGTYVLKAANPASNVTSSAVEVAVNRAPTIDLSPSSITFDEDTTGGPVAITVGDYETPAAELNITAATGNELLLPQSGLTLGGSGANRTLTITPAPDRSGSTYVTLAVNDGRITRTMLLHVTVNPVDDLIVISGATDQTLDEDTSIEMPFTIADVETPAGPYLCAAVADDAQLLPPGSLVIAGTGDSRTLAITPAPDRFGMTSVTLTVTDGVRETSTTFSVTVNPVNDPPVITAVPASPSIGEFETPLGPLLVSISDVDDPVNALALTVSAADGVLLPPSGITLGGTGENRAITLAPGAGQSGSTLVTVTVSDGELEEEATFEVQVWREPVVLAQPSGGDYGIGDPLVLSVVAAGYPALSYQWRKDGVNLEGETAPTLDLESAELLETGQYTVVVTNSAGEVETTAAHVTVYAASSISEHPIALTRGVGQSAVFSVVAGGTGPFTYQWLKDGNPIEGATESVLTLEDVQHADEAGYSVQVSNAVSTATSNGAHLTVLDLPIVVTPPVSQTRLAESSVTFSVVGGGSPPLSYQWFFENAPIEGATEASLTLTGLQASDAGKYRVRVSNPVGEAYSNEATLTVAPAAGAEWEWAHPLPNGNPLRHVAYNASADGKWVVAGDAVLLDSANGSEWTMTDVKTLTGTSAAVHAVAARGSGFRAITGSGLLARYNSSWELLESDLAFPPAAAAFLPSGRAVALSGQLAAWSDDLIHWTPASIELPGVVSTGTQYFNGTGPNPIEIPVEFPFDGTSGQLAVTLSLSYSNYPDLSVKLVGPGNVTVTLFEALSESAQLQNVRFTDDAASQPALGLGTYAGHFQPATPLSALNGKAYGGAWKIRIEPGFGDFGSSGQVTKVVLAAGSGIDNLFVHGINAFSSRFEAYVSTTSYMGWTTNHVLSSADGTVWTGKTSDWGYVYSQLPGFTTAEGNGIQARVIGAGLEYSTNDGQTWEYVNLPNVSAPAGGSMVMTPTAVMFKGGYFYAAAANEHNLAFYESANCVSWTALTPVALTGRERVLGLAANEGIFVGAGASPTLVTSPDGAEWTERLQKQFVHAGKIFATPDGTLWLSNSEVSVDQKIFHSVDGGWTWSPRGVTASNGLFTLSAVAQGNGATLLLSDNGLLYRTTTAAAFSQITLESGSVRWIVFDGLRFLAEAGNSGDVYESADGLAWTQAGIRTGEQPLAVLMHKGRYFGRRGQYILKSDDGLAWENVLSVEGSVLDIAALPDRITALVFNSYFISSRTSEDGGENWVSSPISTAHAVLDAGITAGYGQFAVVASTNPLVNSVLTSVDGVAWTNRTATFPSAPRMRDIAYTPKGYVAVGDNGAVLISKAPIPFGPEFVVAPTSQSILVGQPVVIGSQASGDGPMTYSWTRDGEPLAGGGASHTIDAARPGDEGSYELTVTDVNGRQTSAQFTVEVRGDLPTDWSEIAVPDYEFTTVVHDGERFVARGERVAAFSGNGTSWSSNLVPRITAGYTPAWSASGTGRILAGDGSQVSYSDDGGETWQSEVMIGVPSTGLRDVLYFVDRFIGVGDGGMIAHSVDGIVWTPVSSGVSTNLRGIGTDGSLLVAVGDSGMILRSVDGEAWSPAVSGVTADLRDVAHANGLWVAGGLPGSYVEGFVTTILASADALSWTRRTVPAGLNISPRHIVGGSSGFVVTAGFSIMAVGDAGANNWQTMILDPGSAIFSACHAEGRMVVTGANGAVFSNAGILTSGWTRHSAEAAAVSSLATVWHLDRFYALVMYRDGANNGHRLLESNDGAVWSVKHDFGASLNLQTLASDGTRLYVGGGSATTTVRYSTDGVTWTPAAVNGAISGVSRFQKIDDVWYAIAGTRLLRSTDGNTWDAIYTVPAGQPTHLAKAGNTYLLASYDFNLCRLYKSTNGIDFSQIEPNLEFRLYGLLTFGGRFYATESQGLWTSVDAVNWTAVPGTSALANHNLLEMDGLLAASGGSSLSFSSDGKFWASVSAPFASSLAYDDSRVVLCGTQGIASAARNVESVAHSVEVTGDGQLLSHAFAATMAAPGQRVFFEVFPSYQRFIKRWTLDGVEVQLGGYSYTMEAESGGVVGVEFEHLPTLPVLSSISQSAAAVMGSSTTLSVTVTAGYPAPALQWKKDGNDLPGETGESLVLEDLSLEDNGVYTVNATNESGTASRDITLNVMFKPVITLQPQARSVAPGANFTLAVQAYAYPESLSYQWYKDGVALPGRTQPSLSFTHFLGSDQGSYHVRVSNGTGFTDSASAALVLDESEDAPLAPGSIDLEFRPSIAPNGVGNMLELPDGRFLIQTFSISSFVNDARQTSVAVLKPDGTLDFAFSPGGTISGSPSFAMMPDGGVLLYGDVSATINGSPGTRNHMVRLKPDLTLDPDFYAIRSVVGGLVTSVAFDTDPVTSQPRMWVGGGFTSSTDGMFTSSSRQRLVRLKPSGGVWIFDTTLNSGTGANNEVNTIIPQPGGGAYIAGRFTTVNGTGRLYIARLQNSGALDTGFVPPVIYTPGTGVPGMYKILVLPDGKVLCTGNFLYPNNDLRYSYVCRLASSGSLDTTWNIDTGFDSSQIYGIHRYDDGKILFAGNFTYYNGVEVRGAVRVSASGEIDGTFVAPELSNIGGAPSVTGLLVTAEGDLIYHGNFVRDGQSGTDGLARYSAAGIKMEDFFQGTRTQGQVYKIFSTEDGGAIVAGDLTLLNGLPVPGIAKVLADGSLDMAFDRSGTLSGTILDVARQSDGKWILAGSFSALKGNARANLARLNADGTYDATFNVGGAGPSDSVWTVEVDSQDRIVIGGSFTQYNGTNRMRIARLNPDGSVDATFDPLGGFDSTVQDLAILSGDGVLVAGDFTQYRSVSSIGIARLDASGERDAGYDPQLNGAARAVALMPEGMAVVSGIFTQAGTTDVPPVIRLTAAGALDNTFVAPSDGLPTPAARALAVQPDGKVVFVSSFSVRRLMPDGSNDPAFNAGIGGSTLIAVSLASDGGIFVGGSFMSFNNVARSALIKLRGDLAPGAPLIVAQPSSILVPQGESASLVVIASAYPSATYQWLRNGDPIPGANSSVLEFPNFQPGDGGAFSVIVTNAYGEIESDEVEVALNTPPEISALADIDTAPGTVVGPIAFSVVDGQTAASDLHVTAASSRPDIISHAGIGLSGAGMNRELTLEIAPGQTGDVEVTVSVSDGVLNTVRAFSVRVREGETLWQEKHFSAAQLAEPEIAGLDADPDGDGKSNLLEYALGTDPTGGSDEGGPAMEMTGGSVVFTYTRPAYATDLTYDVQYSATLGDWISIGPGEKVGEDGDLETWSATIPAGAAASFMNLKVTKSP